MSESYQGEGSPRRAMGGPSEVLDRDLGPLQNLLEVWNNEPGFEGHGWNMIALPFAAQGAAPFRLLVNQYNEELRFIFVDDDVPNRGIEKNGSVVVKADQFLGTLDYQQTIRQKFAEDQPPSGDAGDPDAPIHHEPGLWLYMKNKTTDGFDVARLATIPHGNSVLAVGKSSVVDMETASDKEKKEILAIPSVNGLPVGVNQDLNSDYLAPYKHYDENPFRERFNPVKPHKLLKDGQPAADTIKTTTRLEVDSTNASGGIVNIPFIEKQADAASMKSTFWIYELKEKNSEGNHKMVLQYLQVVNLDFFNRQDGLPGLISWPHVSINTMGKVGWPKRPAS